MPYRKVQFFPGQIYHIFNRSVARQPIFLTKIFYQRAMEIMEFYNYCNPPLRFSHYNRLPLKSKIDFLVSLKKNQKLVEIIVFCLMPNHVHFLLKEIKNNGISTFMRNFQNSYAKYLNIKTERIGSVFQSMFKGVRIETDEQFIHVARYIHINPVTSFILKNISELENYPWSSYSIYLNNKSKFDSLNKNLLLSYFSSINQFVKFNSDQIDYQRKLDIIQHLTLE